MQHFPVVNSLLDHMIDGREFESLLKFKDVKIDLASEIRKSLSEIEAIRNRPAIGCLANVVNTNVKASTAIDFNDDLPFSEMIASVPNSNKELDVILVTPGGSGQQVAKFVDKLRPRFESVCFILPYMAMSAGTIFAMSGNEIIMGKNSYIGPTDPQVPNREGQWVPAQAILTLIDDIQKRGDDFLKKGQNPPWTDLQILKQIEGKEIGNALNASAYSMELVEGFLYKYKFSDWKFHSTNGAPVTDDEKRIRAKEVAKMLCDHSQWKTHSRGIPREIAWNECKIKIIHTESINDLDRAVRRFWALMYWAFENTPIYKLFISDNYCIFRNDRELLK
jgi:hypothetical protein